MNRHVRRCILKPVNQRSSSSSPTNTTAINSSSQSPEPAVAARTARGPRDSSTLYKRRRRAPSPSRWIPDSLRGFVLDLDSALQKTIVSVPLPPVTPNPIGEERNSWDQNVGNAPYHPREWEIKPRLPGPGVDSLGTSTNMGRGMNVFGGRDVGNIGSGWGGRVVVF